MPFQRGLTVGTVSRKQRYLEYLKTEHWAKLRQAKIDQVGRQCQCCGREGLVHVHHIRYKNLYDCLLEDLVVMIEECHYVFHDALKYYKLKVEDFESHQIRGLIDQFKTTEKHHNQVAWRIRRKQKPKIKQPKQTSRAYLCKKAVRQCRKTHWKREAVVELVATLNTILESWPMESTENLIDVLLSHDADDGHTKIPETNGNPVTLTMDLINACRTNRKGFTGATVRAFGLKWSALRRGWVRELAGKTISSEQYEAALSGRTRAETG